MDGEGVGHESWKTMTTLENRPNTALGGNSPIPLAGLSCIG